MPEVGIGGHPRPPAWRPLNHGLLRGQLAGRGQHSRPELRDCGSPDSRKGDGFFRVRGQTHSGQASRATGGQPYGTGRYRPRLRTRPSARCRGLCLAALRESGNDLPPTVRRAPRNSRSCVERRALLLELEEPVFVAIDEGHQAGLDDVRRCAYGPPAEFAGCRLDQHPCDGFG